MGKIWNDVKNALRDQAAGSMKHGASTSYRHNRAAILAAKAEREERERRARQVGRLALTQMQPPRWWKVTLSENRLGEVQSNYFEGVVGEKDDKKKIHIATDTATGKLLYARDVDGTVLYSRLSGDPEPEWWK
ncbi:hypothetical protein ACFT9I_27140 [Streptomyces sp. NPDC057137]|uniref:hypothetical protein n=1 Tax=Streptomyces sp. NPDC057137 TaxID=3346030 RepID=UPI00363AE83B